MSGSGNGGRASQLTERRGALGGLGDVGLATGVVTRNPAPRAAPRPAAAVPASGYGGRDSQLRRQRLRAAALEVSASGNGGRDSQLEQLTGHEQFRLVSASGNVGRDSQPPSLYGYWRCRPSVGLRQRGS